MPGLCSGHLAAWIAGRLPFDRIYFYGSGRPLHVSVGPEESRSVVAMLPGPSNRRIPRKVTREWLAGSFRESKGAGNG